MWRCPAAGRGASGREDRAARDHLDLAAGKKAQYDSFVVSLDAKAKIAWSFAATSPQAANAGVAATTDTHVWLAGEVKKGALLGPDKKAATADGPWLARLSADGKVESLESGLSWHPGQVLPVSGTDIVMCGRVGAAGVGIDGKAAPKGSPFVARFDASGKPKWTFAIVASNNTDIGCTLAGKHVVFGVNSNADIKAGGRTWPVSGDGKRRVTLIGALAL